MTKGNALIFEDNLMWSSRLVRSFTHLGYSTIVFTSVPTEIPDAVVAVLNLGSPSFTLDDVVSRLKARQIPVIGHAGHKEKDLLQVGREAACDIVASNSELTFKLESLLARALP